MYLRTNGKERWIGTIAFDLDRTLTDARLRLVPSALRAVQEVRAAGVRTILASGRRPWEFEHKRTEALKAFDALVLEGGGLIGPFDDLRPLRHGAPSIAGAAAWLERKGVQFDPGEMILSMDLASARRLRDYPGRRGIVLTRNRDRVDVTPRGVDKGSGVLAAMKRLGSARRGGVLAFGDGENDVPLFRIADYCVAVANAAPIVRSAADEVTVLPGGRGVARFLETRLRKEARR